MVCRVCGREINNSFAYCPFCGTETKKQVCSACDGELIEGAEFCVKCGLKISNKIRVKENSRKSDYIKIYNLDTGEESTGETVFYKGKEYSVWYAHGNRGACAYLVTPDLEVIKDADLIEEFVVFNGNLYGFFDYRGVGEYYSEDKNQYYNHVFHCINTHTDIFYYQSSDYQAIGINCFTEVNGKMLMRLGDGGIADFSRMIVPPGKLSETVKFKKGHWRILHSYESENFKRGYALNAPIIGDVFLVEGTEVYHSSDEYYFVIRPDKENAVSGPYRLSDPFSRYKLCPVEI